MDVDGRGAGLVAALVPLAAVVFGATVVGLIPRMIVGGVLVFVGLSFLVAWIVDMRRSLPVGEYLIVLAIVVTIATKGLLAGLVVGLVLAVVLFAVNYGRIDLVRESRVRDHVSQQRRPPSRRARRPAGSRRPRPDPPPERVRVLRDGERAPRTDPQTRGGRTDPVLAGRPPARHGRGLIGRVGVPEGGAARGGERVRARVRRCAGSGAGASFDAAG